MQVPFLDLKAQYRGIKTEVMKRVEQVLESSQFILGPEITKFEHSFASAHEAKECITASNGTAAIHLALWALGIGAGDEVIVPANTFIATAEGVVLCGATPRFVDHDEFFSLDADLLERSITQKTKAIIAVHLYGQPARMDAIAAIARKYDLALIEDAAQAHLARYQRKFIGSWGIATCFSFYPGKNLGAYGEGGAVTTNDPKLADAMRLLRDHGSRTKYQHEVSGTNYRLEALQGAILNVKLPYLKGWTESRRRNASRYTELLEGITEVSTPRVLSEAEPVWHLYVIEAENRDALKAHLEGKGIGTGLHYPTPLHQQPAFSHLGYKTGDFPRSEHIAPRILSLPMFPELTDEQIQYVASEIKNFYRGAT
jgi:dTDP-4-amino-4,6-dideoxygalactose transaminase